MVCQVETVIRVKKEKEDMSGLAEDLAIPSGVFPVLLEIQDYQENLVQPVEMEFLDCLVSPEKKVKLADVVRIACPVFVDRKEIGVWTVLLGSRVREDHPENAVIPEKPAQTDFQVQLVYQGYR